MSQYPISTIAVAASRTFGEEGGRAQITARLRNGIAQATCRRFIGVNPSSFSLTSYPDDAADYALPSDFWGFRHLELQGETVLPQRNPWDRWTVLADWASGNFAISGSYQRGQRPCVRRAEGVYFNGEEADRLLADLRLVIVGGGATTSTGKGELECTKWLKDSIAADVDHQFLKEDFEREALRLFDGRVTKTGFRQRIWPPVAQETGRNKPGAPRKS